MNPQPRSPDDEKGPTAPRVRGSEEQTIEPLYSTTRLLLPSIAEIEELHRRALQELREASAQAEDIREAARDEVVALERETEGRLAALREEAARVAGAEAAARLDGLLDQLDEQRRQLSSDHEHEIIETSLAMCRAILGAKIEIDSELIGLIFRETLESAGLDREISVLMHPGDAELLAESLADILESKGRSRGTRVVLDDQQPRGTIRIESERGIHDGSLPARLARLERHVRSRMKGQVL